MWGLSFLILHAFAISAYVVHLGKILDQFLFRRTVTHVDVHSFSFLPLDAKKRPGVKSPSSLSYRLSARELEEAAFDEEEHQQTDMQSAAVLLRAVESVQKAGITVLSESEIQASHLQLPLAAPQEHLRLSNVSTDVYLRAVHYAIYLRLVQGPGTESKKLTRKLFTREERIGPWLWHALFAFLFPLILFPLATYFSLGMDSTFEKWAFFALYTGVYFVYLPLSYVPFGILQSLSQRTPWQVNSLLVCGLFTLLFGYLLRMYA